MHVERNRSLRGVGLRVNFLEVVDAEGVIPDRCRRVAGISWSGAIVASEKFLADAKLFAHLRQAWVAYTHHSILTHNACGRARSETRLLPGLNKNLCVLHRSRRQDAVAQVQDVA